MLRVTGPLVVEDLVQMPSAKKRRLNSTLFDEEAKTCKEDSFNYNISESRYGRLRVSINRRFGSSPSLNCSANIPDFKVPLISNYAFKY